MAPLSWAEIFGQMFIQFTPVWVGLASPTHTGVNWINICPKISAQLSGAISGNPPFPNSPEFSDSDKHTRYQKSAV